jgi:hypothetical protein
MTRVRPPAFLPRDVIARPDFADACDRRDLGEIFRLAVKWGGTGFTVSHLARRCEMSVGRVNDYIKDRKQAQSIEVFERVSDGLRIPGAILGISRRTWEESDDLTAMPEDHKSVMSQREWLRTRRLLNQHRSELTQRALELYPEPVRLGRTGFLMPPQWRLESPVDLASVGVELTDAPAPNVTGRKRKRYRCDRSGHRESTTRPTIARCATWTGPGCSRTASATACLTQAGLRVQEASPSVTCATST